VYQRDKCSFSFYSVSGCWSAGKTQAFFTFILIYVMNSLEKGGKFLFPLNLLLLSS
jgi:hypothetical protein